jgi:glucokinase
VILACDIGGTKIHLAVFAREDGRLRKGAEAFVATAEARSAADVLRNFCREHGVRPDAVGLGVAGPVVDGFVRGANLPWTIRQRDLEEAVDGAPVRMVNDLAASAHGLAELEPADLVTLQAGEPLAGGNRGLVSPGTGLGECILVPRDGDFEPVASEGGHADLGARTDEEIDLLRWLRGAYGRASVERVLSGPGLANVFRWQRDRARLADDSGIPTDAAAPDLPALVSEAALERGSRLAREALRIWATLLGAEAGNHVLRGLTLGGLYLGGGMPLRLLPALSGEPWFLDAFADKEPHRGLLRAVPVHVVTRTETPLLGAARLADAAATAARR